jgi:hypothetical protein
MLSGSIHMQDRSDANTACHWECYEWKGWTQFRNSVSGTYLGCDKSKSNFPVPVADWTGKNGCLVVKAHKKGDCQFLVEYNGSLLKYHVSKKGSLICESHGDGGVWRFLPV